MVAVGAGGGCLDFLLSPIISLSLKNVFYHFSQVYNIKRKVYWLLTNA